MLEHRSVALVVFSALLNVLCAGTAFAGSKSVVLERSSLSNDADADGGGLWQYEGGTMQSTAGAQIGTYIVNRRVTTSGTATFNTAFETITLFFTPSVSGAVPETVILQGAYSYNSGAFIGSVSAASERYTWIIGADASGSVNSGTSSTTLALAWNGAKHLTLP